MYVATIPNRNSRPAILLRESYLENGKVKNRTLKNLSDWPAERVELLRAALRGDGLAPAGEGMEIERALPHGHVLAALGTARAIELDALLPRGKERRHQLALALIVARVLAPSAKLATARALDPATASHSLGATLELGPVKVKELYATLDGLGKHQEGIERRLARRHLGSGTLVLYDVTSSYLEGRHCPLARRGYSRDGKKGKLQIVFGLICNVAGCPVAVEVFEGHCGDPATLSAQFDKLKRRFGLRRMVMVGEWGLITSARIDEDLRPAGFDWMTALRAPAIAKLAGEEGPLQLSLFDQRGLAEIDSPDDPGERLIACRNPALAAERARKREELLAATDVEFRRIQGRVRRARRPLCGAGEIGLAVGAVINRRKVAKPFEITITDKDFHFQRKPAAIAAEAALDGIYVLRRSLPAETLDGERAVLAYKSLARVERAFRSLKTVDIKVRPIYHGISPRVRAHVFLCMLAYYTLSHWKLEKVLVIGSWIDSSLAMLRGGFLSAKEHTALQAVMRHPSEIHGVARRANAILLLDDGWNCTKVAEALYLDDDTVRTWFKRYQAGGLDEMTVFDWKGRSGDLSRERMAELSARLGERLMRDSGEVAAYIAAR